MENLNNDIITNNRLISNTIINNIIKEGLMSIVDMIVPGLTFNKEGLGRAADDDSNNLFAYLIIGLFVIFIPLYNVLNNIVPSASGLTGEGVEGIGLFIALLIADCYCC